jgi:hypothetical protein
MRLFRTRLLGGLMATTIGKFSLWSTLALVAIVVVALILVLAQ